MAITVAFEHPVILASPAVPTALQAKETVVAVLTDDNGGGAVTITHNMGISVADLAAGLPIVSIERMLAGSLVEEYIVTAKAANTIALNAVAGGGATASVRVTMRRPHSIGR